MSAVAFVVLACLPAPLQAQTAAAPRAVPVRDAEMAVARESTLPTRKTFERQLAAAIARGDRHTEAELRRGLGVLLYKQARYADARTELLAALQLSEALGDHAAAGRALQFLGWVAYLHESGQAAEPYWARGLAEMQAAGDRLGEVQLLLDRTYAIRPGPEKVRLLQRVRQLAREIGDGRTEAGALYSLGRQQYWDGNYAVALETLQQALVRFERIGAEDGAAPVLIELGRLHQSHGRPDRAGVFYRRALAIFQRLGDKDKLAQAWGALTNLHRSSGRLRQAVAAGQRALALRVEMGGERDIDVERVRLAHLHVELADYRLAKAQLDEVMRGTNAFTRGLANDPLAEVHLALGEYEQAREAADLAARFTREPAARPFMLANRARAEDKLGQSSQALASVDEALQIIEAVRERLVPTDPMKQGYGEKLQRLFAFAVDLRARLGRQEAALEAAEQARARAFLDLLATRDALRSDSQGGAPELRSSVAGEPSSVAQLAAAADRLNSTILTYWVGPERTIVWVVGAGGLAHTAIVPVTASRVTRLIAQTRPYAGTIEPAPGTDPSLFVRKAPPKRVWRDLYELLMRPVEDYLPTTSGALLTVIPHGPLLGLSFAALLGDRGRYLIERYALHYAPAGAVLAETRSKPRIASPSTAATYLLVADPARPSTGAAGERLPPLPGAVGEIRRIEQALPAGSALSLTGTSAREDRVRERMPGSRVVHFATHAVLRNDRSLDSFLALGRTGAHGDGRLTTQEIYDLSLDADLVVLSACRTASGPVTGDGIVGLTRAFFYAGTSSVVATLWPLADESGRELMPAFYRAWLGGTDKTRALRAAQLALLSRLRARRAIIRASGRRVILEEDPFLWAGYVMLGEP